jgi:hypothetical protein
MKRFDYYTEDVAPEKLDVVLQDCGDKGWELITTIIMQRQIPATKKLTIGVMPAQQYDIEIKFKLIFKKEITDVRN